MKIKISGVLSAPLTEVCAGSEIQLKAVTTSDDVIIRAESSYFVGQDGKYNFEVYPGRYDVYIQFSAEMPQKVGRIGVYEDSKPGTLEEFLLLADGGFFKPEALKEFEKSCADAAAAAAAAKTSETNSANNAAAAAASASAAHTSETNSANNATAAAAAAAAAQAAETNSANNAAAAAASAADLDATKFAKLDQENEFLEKNKFKKLATFLLGGAFSGATTFDALATFNNNIQIGKNSAGNTNKVSCYTDFDLYFGRSVRVYSGTVDGVKKSGQLAFWSPGGMFPDAYIDRKDESYLQIYDRNARNLKIDFPYGNTNGLQYVGSDRIARSIFHAGYLPPAATVVSKLPTESESKTAFYFTNGDEKLYFAYGNKKYAISAESSVEIAMYEDFSTLITDSTTAMLKLERPEIEEPTISLTITETINYDYIGPVNGHCDVASPQEYKVQMYAYTTGEYLNGETALDASGDFKFTRSWQGAKQFRLVRIADSKWITTLEYPLCIRSYWMPADADPEVVSVMKDRCYTYDQACAALALMVQNHEAVERYVTGLCALVGENGGIKFFVNRLSAQSSREYYRTGNAAWVLYALAFYLSKYPTGSNAELARAKLNAGLTWLDGLKVDASGDPRHGLYMGGSGKYLEDGSFDPNYVATWCALEHNVDIYFLFELVGRLTGFTGYELRATALAANIVEKFWIESEGRFRQGVHIDGPDNAAALDQSSWGGIFAVKAAPELAEKCRRYMERFRFGTLESAGYTPYHPDYGYSGHSRGVWTEGTAGVALFERALGNEQRATDLIAGLKPLRNEYGYRDSCDDKKYDTLPDWPSTTNTAWVILTCKPAGFWCVDLPVLDVGIVRY
ncbi:prophage tail fiber N-terminal domain-containing protein [Escherichia coli]|nr:prophage tail fiber N-terminal domain-containing protein [Escherichia coli]HAW0299613.1 hypothetical protein [Escherichia coli]